MVLLRANQIAEITTDFKMNVTKKKKNDAFGYNCMQLHIIISPAGISPRRRNPEEAT